MADRIIVQHNISTMPPDPLCVWRALNCGLLQHKCIGRLDCMFFGTAEDFAAFADIMDMVVGEVAADAN